ncbi:hypothetical protein J437_LFUL017206 [Ladona fulva]|uniref:DDE Tnp4 domain-containing protein n=1 Tax=Ladona fulva TaxID=123851 RepID=A0A8K0KNH3_LADFU|nr:hypothetical protein J437_LFUL017206 [Ladona fulva]
MKGAGRNRFEEQETFFSNILNSSMKYWRCVTRTATITAKLSSDKVKVQFHRGNAKQLVASYEALFKYFTRISKKDFGYLLGKVTPIIRKTDTNYHDAIPADVRLLLTLRYLASGDSYPSLIIIPEVYRALINVLHDFVKTLCTEDDWRKTAKDFEVYWNYPHCIGACDGKHIMIQNPKNSGSMFFNYKGTFSIVLMAIVDANYCFMYANIGCQAKNNLALPPPKPLTGSNILSPYVLVVDDAFPIQLHIMKPFPGYHEKGSSKRCYNYRHSRARRIVKNMFGLLASVFQDFRKPLILLQQLVFTYIIFRERVQLQDTCTHLQELLILTQETGILYSKRHRYEGCARKSTEVNFRSKRSEGGIYEALYIR